MVLSKQFFLGKCFSIVQYVMPVLHISLEASRPLYYLTRLWPRNENSHHVGFHKSFWRDLSSYTNSLKCLRCLTAHMCGLYNVVCTVSTVCLIRVHHRSSLLNHGIYTVQGGVKKLSSSVVVKVLSLPELLADILFDLFALGYSTQYNNLYLAHLRIANISVHNVFLRVADECIRHKSFVIKSEQNYFGRGYCIFIMNNASANKSCWRGKFRYFTH